MRFSNKTRPAFKLLVTLLLVACFLLFENASVTNEAPTTIDSQVAASVRTNEAPTIDSRVALIKEPDAMVLDRESHTLTNRPPSLKDPRDRILSNYEVVPCLNNIPGHLIMGQDIRVEQDPVLYQMRNPKYVCGVSNLGKLLSRPCIVYSFGSWDEISFEVGLHAYAPHCEVHVFDPVKIPDKISQTRYNFTSHHYGVRAQDGSGGKTVKSIMESLGHDHIDIFKIDIEGGELEILPYMERSGLFQVIDQIAPEFHSVLGLDSMMKLLARNGFKMTYARREDRCIVCTEVAMQRHAESG
jgi:hypothetical protein